MVDISFIIPARCEEKLLPATLASIFREIRRTNVSAEVIVVDNGSNDGTARIAASFVGTRIVSEPRRGLASARSAGLALATGDLVAQIDADTIIPGGWLDCVRVEFLRTPSLVGLSGPYIYYDLPHYYNSLTRMYYILGLFVVAGFRLARRPVSMMQGGNLIARKEAIQAVGGYNPRFQFYGEDTDLACRLAAIGQVRFSFKLTALSSGRRLCRDGLARTGLRYAINFIWAAALKRPFTATWEDIR
jgi:glycosyltransferase involved in cell wall biosynthesis